MFLALALAGAYYEDFDSVKLVGKYVADEIIQHQVESWLSSFLYF